MLDKVDVNDIRSNELRIECDKCFGFCCTALYFSKSDGFPNNKESGKPCINLQRDFKCKIHNELKKRGLKGCIAYDCLGAGQKTAQVTYNGQSFIEKPELAQEMFDIFLIIRALHEMLWYLIESYNLEENYEIKEEIYSIIIETKELTLLKGKELLKLDIESHRDKVNVFIRQVSESVRKKVYNFKKITNERKNFISAKLSKQILRGADFRGALLIAADLKNADLSYADFIGSDVRDCNVRGADLSKSIFLTQSQINTMRGDKNTKIPKFLKYPNEWTKDN